jgi:hypothetical protein
MVTVVPEIGSFSSRRTVVDPRSVRSSSLSLIAASASYDGGAVTDSTWERASGTTLPSPEMCRMSVVNWATKSRYLNSSGWLAWWALAIACGVGCRCVLLVLLVDSQLRCSPYVSVAVTDASVSEARICILFVWWRGNQGRWSCRGER